MATSSRGEDLWGEFPSKAESGFNFHEPWNLVIAAGLVALSGLVAGLTIGIMGIDQLELRVIEERGNDKEKRQIRRLKQLLSKHHLVLVTLLLINTICQETLPLFLKRCFPEWATVVFAVTFVLVFGEIIPQAFCSGRWRIPIVRFLTPFVVFISWVFWPLAWPIAKALDCIIGGHSEKYYGRADLKTVVRLHERSARMEQRARQKPSSHGNRHFDPIHRELVKHASHDDGTDCSDCSSSRRSQSVSRRGMSDCGADDEFLGQDEVVVIEGALDLAKKAVSEIMVPVEQVYALSETEVVDAELRQVIVAKGHSRIPVYRETKGNIIGMLYVKRLVAEPMMKHSDAWPPTVRSLTLRPSDQALPPSSNHSRDLPSSEAAWRSTSPPLVAHFVDYSKCPVFVKPSEHLYDLMNKLQTGRQLALVTSDPNFHTERFEQQVAKGAVLAPLPADKAILGIVTIEDIFEELIQEEIYDEFDHSESLCGGLPAKSPMPAGARNNSPAASIPVIVKAMRMATPEAYDVESGSFPRKTLSIFHINRTPSPRSAHVQTDEVVSRPPNEHFSIRVSKSQRNSVDPFRNKPSETRRSLPILPDPAPPASISTTRDIDS